MTDYSKPIGWWCPGCRQRVLRLDGHPAPLVPQHCNETMRAEACIPIFAVIPEGERPEVSFVFPEVHLKETDLGWPMLASVNASDDGETVRRWAERWGSGWALYGADGILVGGTTADAVLFVVEGVTP